MGRGSDALNGAQNRLGKCSFIPSANHSEINYLKAATKEQILPPASIATKLIAINVLITSIGCGVVASVIFAVFGDTLQGLVGFPVRAWHGLVLGMLGGAIYGIYEGYAKYHQLTSLIRTMSSVGFEPLSELDVQSVKAEIHALLVEPQGTNVELEAPFFRCSDKYCLVVANVFIEVKSKNPSQDKRDPENSKNSKQTCAYVEFHDDLFPIFRLNPKGLISKFFGISDGTIPIEFEESNSFNACYQLNGVPEESTRKLFSRYVRDFFETNPGWKLICTGNRMILFRPGRVYDADRIGEFVDDTKQCMNVISRAL